MKGLFIPDITAEMFRNGCLESIEALMAEGKIYDIDYEPDRKKGKWNYGDDMFEYAICSSCKWDSGEAWEYAKKYFRYCPNCGADMRGDGDD